MISIVCNCLYLHLVIDQCIADDMTEKCRVSRRKLEAIAFLSNIRAEDEDEEDLPGYSCLQDTQLLNQFRRQSRSRRRLPYKRCLKKKEQLRSSSRERTPEVDHQVIRRCGESFRRKPVTETRSRQLESVSSVSKTRRQLSADDALKVCSSLESVVGQQQKQQQHHGGDTRVRQVSGTLSDNSHCSNRELVYIKADDLNLVLSEDKIFEEKRMILISHCKVPFSVASTICYNKDSKVSRRYSVSRLSLR